MGKILLDNNNVNRTEEVNELLDYAFSLPPIATVYFFRKAIAKDRTLLQLIGSTSEFVEWTVKNKTVLFNEFDGRQ